MQSIQATSYSSLIFFDSDKLKYSSSELNLITFCWIELEDIFFNWKSIDKMMPVNPSPPIVAWNRFFCSLIEHSTAPSFDLKRTIFLTY